MFFLTQTGRNCEDKLVFPYPFFGMSPQHIWWEDLLQTVSVRFHRSCDLTRYINVPNADEITETFLMFLKRGAMLRGRFEYNDSERSGKVRTIGEIEFINQHSYPVELYWFHSTSASLKETIQANNSSTHVSIRGRVVLDDGC